MHETFSSNIQINFEYSLGLPHCYFLGDVSTILWDLLATATVGFGNVYAQEAGDMATGINLVFYNGQVKHWYGGIGVKIQYNITTPVRVEAAFVYTPNTVDEYVNRQDIIEDFIFGMRDFAVNVQYLIPVMKKLNVYPVAGLGLMRFTHDYSDIYLGPVELIDKNSPGKYTSFCVNLGGGIECKLGKRVSLQGEVKYRIGFNSTLFANYYKPSSLMISIGAVYKF